MNKQPNDVDLLAYQKRLDQIGAIVEREVHKVLIDLAREMPLTQSTKSIARLQALAAQLAAASEPSDNGREQGRALLRLYTERLRIKSNPAGNGPPLVLLTYAQMLYQALREPQTLH